MKKMIVLALFLSSCTVNVMDKRLTREEVALAFKQRDAVLEGIATKLKEMEAPKKK